MKKLATLPELLKSRNDFIEVTRFIKDISADTNNDKGSSGDKEVFNNLDSQVTEISNNKVLKSVIKRLEKSVFNLDQLRQKSIVFQNKMIYIVYQLFNSFSLSQKPLLRFDK